MSLYFDEFGGMPYGKSEITYEQIPGPWDKVTPAQGDILQMSLDALLRNDVMQESSTAHIQITREGNEHAFSAVDMDLSYGHSVIKAHSTNDTLGGEPVWLGAAAPIPTPDEGLTYVLGAKSADDGVPYMSWIHGTNSRGFFIDGTKDKEYSIEQTASAYFCDIAIIDTSAFNSDINGDIDYITVKANGEFGYDITNNKFIPYYKPKWEQKDHPGETPPPEVFQKLAFKDYFYFRGPEKSDSRQPHDSVISLTTEDAEICIYGVEYENNAVVRYNITPVQRISLFTSGMNLAIVKNLLYWACGSYGQSSISNDTKLWNIGFYFQRCPFDIDCAADGDEYKGFSHLGIGLRVNCPIKKLPCTGYDESSITTNNMKVHLIKDIFCEIFYK